MKVIRTTAARRSGLRAGPDRPRRWSRPSPPGCCGPWPGPRTCSRVSTPAPGPRNPERVIAAAVSRAADRVHQLPVYFDRVETSLASLAEITECLPDQALLSLIEGPGDAIGVVSI